MNDIEKRSYDYWSERAPEFSDLRMQDYNSSIKTAFKKELRQQWGEGKQRRVLDMGCGAGFFSMILRELEFDVYAVDFSEKMLEEANCNAVQHELKDIHFIQMNVEKLLFDSAFFDFVISRNVTWILNKPDDFYKEMVRVLKPGGKFINIDANYGQVFKTATEMGERPTHPTQSLEQLLERNAITNDLYISTVNRPLWDIEQLMKLDIKKYSVVLDIEKALHIEKENGPYSGVSNNSKAEIFMISGEK